MIKSKRLLMLALAIAAGAAPLVQQAIAAGDDFVPMCYKNRNIQIPFYLRARYMVAGATDGTCPVSP